MPDSKHDYPSNVNSYPHKLLTAEKRIDTLLATISKIVVNMREEIQPIDKDLQERLSTDSDPR